MFGYKLGRLLHKPKGVPYYVWGGIQALRYAIGRFRSVDTDVHASKDGVLVAVHWMREWRWPDGRKVVGSPASYTYKQLQTMRPRRGGPYRIQAVSELFAEIGNKVVFALEAKPNPLLESVDLWRRVKADADKYGARVVVMTIQRHSATPELWEAEAVRRLQAAKAAGFPVMVLSRGWLNPDKWGFVDAYKGNAVAERSRGKDLPASVAWVGPGSTVGASAHPSVKIPVLARPRPAPVPAKPPAPTSTPTPTQRVVADLRAHGITVLDRTQWGSEHAEVYAKRRIDKPSKRPCSTVVQHITVTKPTGDFNADVRVVERIGMERFGSGVSYNFIVNMTTGVVAVGQPLDAKGTHTVNTKGVAGYSYDQNYAARAIAVLGMPDTKLSAVAERSIVAILASLVRCGEVTREYDYDPHSKFKAKDCPCDSTRDRMPAMKQAADQIITKEAAK